MKPGVLFDLKEYAPPVAGVRRFQRRHALKTDGVVGPATLAELNTSVQARITQIKLNMLRWRRLPERPGQRYLRANIPGFKLDVVENHRVVRSMRTIVGKPERPTPVMSAMMTYVDKIEAKVKCRQRTVVVLKEPIPVHLVYMTAWAGEDGTVYFYHDLYDCDPKPPAELNRSDAPGPPSRPIGRPLTASSKI